MNFPETNNINDTWQLSGYFNQSGQFYYLLTDSKGQILFTNPNFQKKITGDKNFPGTSIKDFLLAAEKDSCKRTMQQCLAAPGTLCSIDLHLVSNYRNFSLIRWEISAPAVELTGTGTLQWIGIDVDSIKEQVTGLGTKVGVLPERYKAYELGTSGLWRLELKVPAPATETPEEIIDHLRKQSFLAECNDNMARMYGYEKAEELLGSTMEDLMDLQDPVRMENLKTFIRNGFNSVEIETKEFDRHGATKYFLNNMTGIVENGLLKRIWGTQQDITEQKLAEEKIHYLARLMETVSDIIISQDTDLNIVSWNPMAEKIYGYTAGEVTGRKISDFLHFEFQDISRETVLEKIFVNERWEGEASVVNRWGRSITVLTTVTKIKNERNELTGFVSVSKEITERKKTEDQLRKQSAILDNVSDLIMTTDFSLTILSWNKKAEEVVGYSAEEVVGKFLGDVVRPDYSPLSPQETAAELNEKGFWQGELSIINKYGAQKHLLHTSSYLLNEAGERIAIIGTGKDITERKKAEDQLQKSELFYRNLIKHSLDGVLVTDENGKIGFASPSITEILGYQVDEVIGKITFDFAHPEDRPAAITAFREELAGAPKIKFIRVRLKKKSGEWTWCIIRGHNLIENPYVNGVMVYFYDDTLRKEAEDALIESESKLRTQANILMNVNDVIVAADLNRIITAWNRVTEELSGIPATEAIGKSFSELLDSDFSPHTLDEVAAMVNNKGIWRGEMSFTGRSGEKKYLLYAVSLLHNQKGDSIGFLGVGKDITERKKAEAKLQESELFYRNMISHSLDGIIMTTAYGQITYCGPSVTKLSGYEPEHLLGRNIFELVHPDDVAVANEVFILEINKKSTLNYILLRLKHSNGNWVWCAVRGHNLLKNPVFNSVVIYFSDDSKRKEIEDKLRKSEEHFRNLIYNLRQGVVLQSENGETMVCNSAALDMLGVREDQLLGKKPFDRRWNIIREDGRDFPGDDQPVAVAIKTKKPVRDVVMGVYRPLTNDRVWLLVNVEPILDAYNAIVNIICSFTDITEQRRLSRELVTQEIQKQRLLAQATIDGQEKERLEIGKELHDNISQQLTTARLYLEVVKEKAPRDIEEMLVLSHKSITDIIHKIRQISQSLVPPTLGDIGLVESIQDLCDSLKGTHTFSIDFFHRHFREKELPDNMKLMLFRIIQEQVNNIIRHAHANAVEIRLQSDAESVILIIKDNGAGFDRTHYKKGLGLINIINRAGLFNGKVEIDAAPGKGCKLLISIPFTRAEGE